MWLLQEVVVYGINKTDRGGNMSDNIVNSPRAIHLVEWFLHKENMSHKKIQKLCYYAQAWNLVINNEEIIPDFTFEAWIHGPVNREIWSELNGFSWRDIQITPGRVEESLTELGNLFTENQIEVLEQVWEAYGKFSADELEALTHSETPWQTARAGIGHFERGNQVISKQSMKEFYSSIYG